MKAILIILGIMVISLNLQAVTSKKNIRSHSIKAILKRL